MNKKGFTLIELIGVIIILGILLLISIPAISGVIFESKEGAYANNISSMITEVETLYQEKKLGSLLDKDQLMIVPIKDIEFDRSKNDSSPFAEYDFSKSYIILEKSNYSVKSYATIIDKSNKGVFETLSTCVGRPEEKKNGTIRSCEGGGDIKTQETSKYVNIANYYNCDGDDYDLVDTVFEFKGEEYVAIETREYNNNTCSSAANPDKYPVIVFEKR